MANATSGDPQNEFRFDTALQDFCSCILLFFYLIYLEVPKLNLVILM